MVLLSLLLFTLGLVVLAAGAEGLVRGASRLAEAMRVSPLVIGLTVVALGTSFPEFVVSVAAAYQGNTELAVANVVGSNLVSILLVLGPTALIAPVVVQATVIRREVPIVIGASLLFLLLAGNGLIGRLEGGLLFVGLLAYLVFTLRTARTEPPEVQAEFEQALPSKKQHRMVLDVAFVVGGLVLLMVGGRLVVDAAVALARDFGLSERIIGLTLVSAGTSVPELGTTLVAAYRRQIHLAVGNVLGSNVFNILGVLGAAALVRPLPIPVAMYHFDIPLMVVVVFTLLPIVMTHHRISRIEGALLLAIYVCYVVVLLVRGV